MKKNILIILILFLALTLRVIQITQVPPSLNWDEVSHGYNAYSILKTGKDEWGVSFPTIFRAYGDYKLPAYIYVTAISEAIFGLNAFAVRLSSAVAGVLVVFFSYLLVKELFAEKVALLTSLLVAVEPWSLFLSRGGFEANLGLAFIVAGMYFFVRGMGNWKYLIISSLLFGLSVWTYNSARIFVPVFLFFCLYLYRSDLRKAYRNNKLPVLVSAIVLLLFIVPMFFQLFSSQGSARYENVEILDAGAIGKIIEQRQKSTFNPAVTRLLYNRPTYFLKQFILNWTRHYSADFLYLKGGSDYQFNIPDYGLLYPVNAVFLLIGIVVLLKRRNRSAMLILGWFYLGPIASSLTREAPHTLRAITMLPSPMIISSLGLVSFLEWSVNFLGKKMQLPTYPAPLKLFVNRSHALYFAFLLILAIFINNYLTRYFEDYAKNYSWSWQYGYKQVVDYAKDSYDQYDKIIVSKKYGEPHEFFLFFWPWNPAEFQNDPNLNRFYQSNWYWVDRFDKFWFVNDWEIPSEEWEDFVLESGEEFNCDNQHCLLITSPENHPKSWIKAETINFLDEQPAFEILKNITS